MAFLRMNVMLSKKEVNALQNVEFERGTPLEGVKRFV